MEGTNNLPGYQSVVTDGEPVQISTVGKDAFAADMGRLSSGHYLVAWSESPNNNFTNVYVATVSVAGVKGTDVLIHSGSWTDYALTIAPLANDRALVCFDLDDGTNSVWLYLLDCSATPTVLDSDVSVSVFYEFDGPPSVRPCGYGTTWESYCTFAGWTTPTSTSGLKLFVIDCSGDQINWGPETVVDASHMSHQLACDGTNGVFEAIFNADSEWRQYAFKIQNNTIVLSNSYTTQYKPLFQNTSPLWANGNFTYGGVNLVIEGQAAQIICVSPGLFLADGYQVWPRLGNGGNLAAARAILMASNGSSITIQNIGRYEEHYVDGAQGYQLDAANYAKIFGAPVWHPDGRAAMFLTTFNDEGSYGYMHDLFNDSLRVGTPDYESFVLPDGTFSQDWYNWELEPYNTWNPDRADYRMNTLNGNVIINNSSVRFSDYAEGTTAAAAAPGGIAYCVLCWSQANGDYYKEVWFGFFGMGAPDIDGELTEKRQKFARPPTDYTP